MGFLFLVKMIKKYYAAKGLDFEIKEVDILRETNEYVTLSNGVRTAKETEYEKYCDTHHEAVDCILLALTKKALNARRTLGIYEDKILEFKKKHNI